MNKRSFLQGLLTALAAGVAAGVSAQPRRRVLIQVSPLAGFQYHAGGALWHDLRPANRSPSCANETTLSMPVRYASTGTATSLAICRKRRTRRWRRCWNAVRS